MGIEVKERPITFSGAMVRALLEGRKTQTRRVVKKWYFNSGCEGTNLAFSGLVPSEVSPGLWRLSSRGEGGPWNERAGAICPYGKTGERLWVRETWAAHVGWDKLKPTEITHGERSNFWFAADKLGTPGTADIPSFLRGKWRPSIFMPRWASRITLEVTEVRVQRLQEISFEDAKAEGSNPSEPRMMSLFGADSAGRKKIYDIHGALAYQDLWESINGPGSWAANPWVWAVSFKVVKP